MLATSLQIILVLLLAAALGVGNLVGTHSVGWAIVAAALVLLAHLMIMVPVFTVVHVLNRHDPAPRASWGQMARAWWWECWAELRVFAWWQAFRSNAVPDRLPLAPASGGPRGVVLIHGFLCNRGFWTPYLRQLQAQGVPFIAVNLEPAFGSIGQYIPIIEAAVQKATERTGHPPHLVCHSMGGLAARAWLRQANDDARVDRIITIGTPHHGTALSHFTLFSNTRQMERRSQWLIQLAATETPQRMAKFTCWYSHADNIVAPASTATLNGADNHFLPARGHVDMAFDPELMGAVMKVLNPPT